jgi:hypothetical protein
MAYVDWMIKGPKITSCSCDYGCPCEFNALPTNRDVCEGMEGHLIEEGYFGDVRLDGLIIGARFRWPGPVHLGRGTVQGFIDERASEAQREALFTILDGKEQEPTTAFNIYGSTIEREIDPIFGVFDFACDLKARTGHFKVPGVGELVVEPIKNPVTGKDHFAQIGLPGGFEYKSAEMASATIRSSGDDLPMSHDKSYGAMWYAAYGPYGIIEEEQAA